MSFHLVGTGWADEFRRAVQAAPGQARLVAPFIKEGAVLLLLDAGLTGSIQVITRYNLDDFLAGVSDIAALRLLLKHRARIRGIANLHAKLYLFGQERVIVTSANLTRSALERNHEFGIVADEPATLHACEAYFTDLWNRCGPDLDPERVEEWDRRITEQMVQWGGTGAPPRMGDEGVDIRIPPEPLSLPPRIAEAPQSFVKFFGEGHRRSPHTETIQREVMLSGSHKAASYSRRPKLVQDGAVMFMARLVGQPDDIAIYGRAVALRHEPGRDDASAEDIQLRSQKKDWPYSVRVHDPEFIAGRLRDGVLLGELMEELGPNAFATTQENIRRGRGNTNPRASLRQQPAVRLSAEGFDWVNERLEQAFSVHGKLPPAVLAGLDDAMRRHNAEVGA